MTILLIASDNPNSNISEEVIQDFHGTIEFMVRLQGVFEGTLRLNFPTDSCGAGRPDTVTLSVKELPFLKFGGGQSSFTLTQYG